ncbi:MAG TPA: amidohydrolase [Clostridiales bacterium]|jgi:amidohydrolase|nr:amidohydrolase [Clostridiales bacterium]
MKERIKELANQLEKEFIELSDEIYKNPELGYEEYNSCRLHEEILEKFGFNVTKKYLGVDTAFRAEYQSDKEGPTIAFMSEYDALPGIGHGCGHNILGTTSTGAGIILKHLIDDIGGRVVVFGTPAEETSGAKVLFVEKGAFNDVDVALVAHPNMSYNKSGKSLALEAIQFEYKGKPSHAASSPEKGINALDAVINTFNNINALRQQTKPEARIHGVIKDGGKAANIIPDYCMAQFYVRAQTKGYLNELVEKVKRCAEGAAFAAGVELNISNYEYPYDNMVTNQVLSEVFTGHLTDLGITDILEPRQSFGSIDAGNVSHVCPTIHPYFDIVGDINVGAHTVEFAESTMKPYAYENMMITIQALVSTAVDVIRNKELLDKINEEFKNTEK